MGRGRLREEQSVGDDERVLPHHVAQGLRVRVSHVVLRYLCQVTDMAYRSSSLQYDAEGQTVMQAEGF